MSEELKTLNNIRSLRAQSRELPLETLEDILEKFNVIVSERREEEEAKRNEISERTEKLNKLRQLMLDDGIDPSELLEFSTARQNLKKSVQLVGQIQVH
ncbi:global DNA-binding transcriptional dual regulator H-NS [Leclercia adecarboxylata]|uniref:Global DNA-binding transcriptional dual regulator H-NS n=1 Tax=Leclercia adecarboxylata TaxID=83655 RepID=A0A4U9I2U5_9ENTR|nr:global DNA-binding transcriptional dual regulator H-NS [Leclercia adecarboxylata]